MKERRKISINSAENWGGLVEPEKHLAAFGARVCDSRSRDFQFFGDRQTEIGDENVVSVLHKWACSPKMIRMIKKNTRFDYDMSSVNVWGVECMIGRKKDIHAVLKVRCAGEYMYLQAYADYHKESADGDQGKKENQ